MARIHKMVPVPITSETLVPAPLAASPADGLAGDGALVAAAINNRRPHPGRRLIEKVDRLSFGTSVILNPSFEDVSAEQSTNNTLNNPANVDAATYNARINNWTPVLPPSARYGSVAAGSEFGPPPASEGSRLLGLGLTNESAGPVAIEQSIPNWDPSRIYHLRFDASSRGGPSPDMNVYVGGQRIAHLPAVPASNLALRTTDLFTPTSATQTLRLEATGADNTDRTLWVDNLRLVSFASVGSGLVKNPSMEIDARATFDGNGYGIVSGWDGASGLNEISAGHPFADTGTFPANPADFGDDADPNSTSVLFRQGTGHVTQRISNLVVGQQYTLSYVENSRNCCGGTLTVGALVSGLPVVLDHPVDAVGGSNPYTEQSGLFTITAGMLDADGKALLDFNVTTTGDRTWVLDNVSIVPVPEPTTVFGLAALGAIGTCIRRRRA